MRVLAMQGLLLAVGLFLVAAPSASAAIAYAPCPSSPGFECGSLDVPLDRSGAVPGTVRIAAQRRASPGNTTGTALVALAGGPGQAALPLAGDFATLMAPALATRDLLVFDQRGTGASTPLSCRLNGSSLTDAASECAGDLGARRGAFTTSASVDDLEALRVESGYNKLALYGVSYGTKVALDYAARYPKNVESIVLDSVVLPAGPDTLQRSTFGAMRRVLNDLCAGGECAGISSNPLGQLAGQVASLARKPLTGRFTDGRGRRLKESMTGDDLFNILVSGDLNPTLRAELPAALTSSRRGDTAPLIRLAARSAGIIELQNAGADFSDPVFAATLCEEGIFPWDRAAGRQVRAQQANAIVKGLGPAPFYPFLGSSALSTQIIDLCLGWPVATPAPAAPAPLPVVPTLVIDGAADLRTPLEDAAQIATLIPGAQILQVPYTGHSALAADNTAEHCAERAVGEFYAGAAVTPCAASGNPFSPTPVAPTRISRLQGTGANTKVGRTVTAALRTASDMRRQVIGDLIEAGQLPSRLGGLRGGRATVSSRGTLTLTNVVYVPGVLVSGSVPLDSTRAQTLHIKGDKGAHGTLRVTPARITGVVGGRRINLVARSAAATRSAADPPYAALLRSFRLRHAG
jgi:pimeloyl-ACP methyl ester carboxylesterase